jgi:hypothetical protein
LTPEDWNELRALFARASAAGSNSYDFDNSQSAGGLMQRGSPPTRRPLHDLQPCVIVEGADVVVTRLGFGREDARGVVRGLRTRYADTPFVVAADVADELERELDGCIVVPEDAGPARVVAAVLDTPAAPAL